MADEPIVRIADQRNRAAGIPFRYQPIEIGGFDRDIFVGAQAELGDLEQYVAGVNKDPHNLKARQDLSEFLFGDPKFHVGLSPEAMNKLGKDAADNGKDRMGKYAERNFDEMFGKLDAGALESFAGRVPLYKTGKDPEHDGLVELMGEVRSMGETAKSKEIDKMRDYVLKELKNSNTPDWAKKAVGYLAGGDDALIKKIFTGKYQAKMAVVSQALSDSEGKLDEKKVRKLIEDSLNKAKDAYKDETDERKRADIWKNDIRPYYLALAQALYPSEREAYDADRPEEIRDMDDRVLERREMGMAA